MNLLIEYVNGKTEIVYVSENELGGKDWRKYILENYKDIKNAHCNLRESLFNTGKVVVPKVMNKIHG